MVRLPIYEREKKRISSYFVREIIKNIEGFFFFFFKIEWKKVEQCTCYYTFQLIEQSRSSIYDFVYLEKITLEIIIKITNFACIQIFFFFWYKSRKIQYIYIYTVYIRYTNVNTISKRLSTLPYQPRDKNYFDATSLPLI